MKLIVMLSFFALSTVFLFINSYSEGRNNLFPAAAIFILIGGFLLTGQGIQIQSGTDYQYTEYNNKTVVGEEINKYETLNSPLPGINTSNLLGILFIIMGAAYMVMAAPGRFRTLLSRR